MKTDISIKIVRTITAFCILQVFILAGVAAFGQVTRAKTTEELIAEVEAEAKKPAATADSPASAGVSLEKEPRSAAEILAEIEALSKPTNAASPETEETPDETGSASLELPVDTSPLPDEVIGEYAVDEDADDGLDIKVVEDTAIGKIASAAAETSLAVASETLFEKADALEPQLMLAGTPVVKGGEAQVSEKISGMIVAEKQPLARRRHIFRWVLKTEDGRRIPLKSNIKLLQEVRRDNILDSKVSLTGRYVSSGLNDKLRYFVMESAVVLDDDSDNDKAATNGKNNASAESEEKKGSPQKKK